jgi:acetoacetyl-CoA synthetase
MGTAEFYRVVDTLPEIRDALVIESGRRGEEGKLWLFLVLEEARELDGDLIARLRATLRESLSPRHVPDEIRAVPDLPRTLSGKKLEVPIRRLLSGVSEERALDRGTLANPESLAPLLAAARAEKTS